MLRRRAVCSDLCSKRSTANYEVRVGLFGKTIWSRAPTCFPERTRCSTASMHSSNPTRAIQIEWIQSCFHFLFVLSRMMMPESASETKRCPDASPDRTLQPAQKLARQNHVDTPRPSEKLSAFSKATLTDNEDKTITPTVRRTADTITPTVNRTTDMERTMPFSYPWRTALQSKQKPAHDTAVAHGGSYNGGTRCRFEVRNFS